MQKYGDNWTQSTMETQCIMIFWESCIMSTHSSLTKKEGYVISIQGCLTEFKRRKAARYMSKWDQSQEAILSRLPISLRPHSVLSLLHLASVSVFLTVPILLFLPIYSGNIALPDPHLHHCSHFRDSTESDKRLFSLNPGYCK